MITQFIGFAGTLVVCSTMLLWLSGHPSCQGKILDLLSGIGYSMLLIYSIFTMNPVMFVLFLIFMIRSFGRLMA